MDKLKPCPFCGGEVYIENIGDAKEEVWMIECDFCGGSACFSEDGGDMPKEKVVEHWNRRAGE